MVFLKRFAPASLLIPLFIFASCSTPAGDSSSANPESNRVAAVQKKANDKAEELSMLVNFTLEPEDIVWLQSESPKRIVAVFRMDEEKTKKLADQLATRSAGNPYSIQVEDWFPAELVAQSENTPNSMVEGTEFPADDFYQDPYTKGVVVRIKGSDFFVLELSARQTP